MLRFIPCTFVFAELCPKAPGNVLSEKEVGLMMTLRKKLIALWVILATLLSFKLLVYSMIILSAMIVIRSLGRILFLIDNSSYHYCDAPYMYGDFCSTWQSDVRDEDDWVLGYHVTGIYRIPGDSIFH